MVEKLIQYFAKHYVNRYWVLLVDTVTSVVSSLLVLAVFDYFTPYDLTSDYLALAGFSAVISLLAFLVTRSYAGIVRHTTMREMWRISFASIIKAVLVMFLLMYLTNVYAMSHVTYSWILVFSVLDMILTLFLLIMVRVLLTNIYNAIQISASPDYFVKNTLIYGTDDDSVHTLSFLEKTMRSSYRCAGFISRDMHDKSKLLCGYRIYHIGNKRDFARLATSRMISAIVFPSNVAARNEQDNLVKMCSERHIQILVRPSLANFEDDSLFRNKIREVKIEDLLGRDEIKISIVEIREFLTDKVVVVTGGAGSIGGELCRQLINMPIRKLILIDIAETPMHNMQLELRSQAPRVDKKFIIGDVRNKDRIDSIFNKYRPNVVFHAAAYKHVPLMESNPIEAVQSNVFGTKNVVDASIRFNIEKFVMISTDKAVNPTNVMGASKRIAEIYVQTMGKEIASGRVPGKTKFITTRFGNVLGSNGSVIPLFKEQIAKGGPVTVTDPRIIRYFMTISEACSLVLEAATMGEGNDIFVFDMGDPVKIDDLAKKMISLAGLELGRDIEIKYVGLRPGEKLYEELLKDEENTLPTVHKKIFRAKVREYDIADVEKELETLRVTAAGMRKDDTVMAMKRIVPEYKSANSRYQRLDSGGGV